MLIFKSSKSFCLYSPKTLNNFNKNLLYLSPQNPLLKISNFLIKNQYIIISSITFQKSHAKINLSATCSQRAFNIKPYLRTSPVESVREKW